MKSNPLIKILIIDDEYYARKTIIDLLREFINCDLKLYIADNLYSGVESFKKEKPDIVFLDINLPDGDGIALYDITNTQNSKVIIITANPAYIKIIKQYNIDAYLLKPIDPYEFFKITENVLSPILLKNNSQTNF